MLIGIQHDGGENDDQFVTVVEQLVNASNWQYDGKESEVAAARQVACSRNQILRLMMPRVRAQLELERRSRSDIVCEISLHSTLDPHLQAHDGTFTGDLANAHYHIGSKFTTDLLEPCADTQAIAKGRIPTGTCSLEIRATSAALSAAALEAEWLCSQIEEPLETYLSATNSRRFY
jgi:hypothetical protein